MQIDHALCCVSDQREVTVRFALAAGEEVQDADADSNKHEGNESEGQAAAVSRAAVPSSAHDWHGPIKPEDREALQQVWERLKQTVEDLPHAGCYTVASVAYRRQAAGPICK